jgi:hypothetical protein
MFSTVIARTEIQGPPAEKQDPPSFALEVANNPYRDQMQLRCLHSMPSRFNELLCFLRGIKICDKLNL